MPATREETMSKIQQEVLAANQQYAAKFDKGDLPMPPGRHFAIPPNTRALPRATPTSSATPAAVPATTPSARW
jgi:hypothetical protein